MRIVIVCSGSAHREAQLLANSRQGGVYAGKSHFGFLLDHDGTRR
ncbi:MAG: hypothetical protein ABR500_05615 [Dermatophilaceae bacterium]